MSLCHSGYLAMGVELPRRKNDKEMRKSIPRHIDKKFRFPEEETGVWNSQGEVKDKCFFLHSLVRII